MTNERRWPIARTLGGVGLAVGMAAGGYGIASATSPKASPTPPVTAAPAPRSTAVPDPGGRRHGCDHPGRGHDEAVSDVAVMAKPLGMTEADLSTALKSGQTVAQVAKAHNVDVAKVVDALVADQQEELAAEVRSGRLTQAEADQMKPELTRRATDRVNGTHRHHLRDGRGPGRPADSERGAAQFPA